MCPAVCLPVHDHRLPIVRHRRAFVGVDSGANSQCCTDQYPINRGKNKTISGTKAMSSVNTNMSVK